MTTPRTKSLAAVAAAALLILGCAMSACATGGASWKEEVLLHDGKALVVERTQTYGGRHEIGQRNKRLLSLCPAQTDPLHGKANTAKTLGGPTLTCFRCTY